MDGSTDAVPRRRRRFALAAAAAFALLAPLVTSGTAQAITGGTTVPTGDFRAVAEVIYTPPPGTPGPGGLCTGTLVHPRFVLTAQHCAETVAASTLTVRLGDNRRGFGRLVQVNEIRKYPGYGGGANDVVLLRLQEYVTGIPTIRLATPAEANLWDGQMGGPFTQYDQATATGWGVNAAGQFPATLQRRIVDVTRPTYDTQGFKRITLASAGPCGGDSGGPLLVTVNGVPAQVGVLKAAGCANAGAWYSEVGAGVIRDWIRYQIPDIDSPNAATCRQGYVWRNAFSGDAACVPPASRTQAAADNAQRYNRWYNGAYGPYTCVNGYVWRTARPDDLVCVTPAVRSQTAAENSLAASRVN